MPRHTLLVTSFVMLVSVSAAFAIEAPRIIPRRQHISRPVEQVYGTVKNYFADQSLSLFQLKSVNSTTHVIVATRSGIDDQHWRQWAFCPSSGLHMIYQLRDGSVTVTVTLQKAGAHATFASVTADFQGSYGLGANNQTVACTSTGALEDEILTVAAGGAAKK